MRTGSSDTQFRGHRGELHVDARLKKARKSRHYRIDLEGLEARTLLATAPAAAPTTISGSPLGPVNLTSLTSVSGSNPAVDGNENSPTVVVDPYDSQKVFAVWGQDLSSLSPVPTTNAIVEGAYSSDGGTNWTSLGTSVNPVLFPDPLTASSPTPTPYTQVTDPSVAFDSRGDVYVLALQTSGASDGAMILTKFNFSSSTANRVALPNNGIVYQWVTGSDAATTPTLAVDSSTHPFGVTPPTGMPVPTDIYTDNVYIAWASIDTEPANPNPFIAPGFNPDRAELIVGTPISSPTGNESTLAFSAVTTVNLNGNFFAQRNSHPQLVINPGNTTNSNQNSVNPGQITIGWEDFGTNATASPPVTLLLSSIVQPGDSYGFTGSTGIIQPGVLNTTTNITTPITTSFSDPVSVPNPGAINNLTVTIDVTDQQSVANLSVVLIAPNGAQITLVANQNNAAGTANTGQGLPSGNSIGVLAYSPTGFQGVNIGTIFDDNATRNIFDPTTTGTNGNSAANYIGFFRPEGGSLKTFISSLNATQNPNNLNGPWTLAITNFSSAAPASGVLRDFSLQFSTRMTSSRPTNIAGRFGFVYPTNTPIAFQTLVVGGALGNNYPTAAPSTPNGVGPGLVLAEDNTLGPYSPYEGRIYASFVGYFNVAAPFANDKNPTTNTDIFLVYSDNGGATWSSPELVNNDQSITDGFSQSNDTLTGNNMVTGRTQFGPQIAVDQSTGTVVLSWRDARNDAANARVATFITTSIDGGNTFGPQTYANPAKTSVDAITGQTNIIGPASDNQAGGNGQRDATFGYGNQMGLAVADGQLFPIWAGNFYGPNPAATNFINSFYNAGTGAVNAFPLNIWYQPMTIAAGPRIISSTMGPVVDTTLTGSAVDLPNFIPPVNSQGVTSSTIPITGDPSLNVSKAVGSIQVTVSLIYPTDGNLTLTLIAPGGQTVILYQNPNDKGQSFTNTTFSDSAAGSISGGTAPYTGTFRPVQPLSGLDGIQAVGNWQLQVSGGIGPNGGILQSWSLSINGVASKPTSFEVTFDRPVDPQALLNANQGTFTAGDVEVSYHDTTNGDTPIPLKVLSVTPVKPPGYVTDPTQDGVDGYTTFLVTFNPDEMPNGSASGITNYTGTYSYVVAPDNGAVLAPGATPTPIAAPIWSFDTVPQSQPTGTAVVPANLPIPTWGPGGSGTQFDETTSTTNYAGFTNETISGVTVTLNIIDPLVPPGLGNDGDLFIELIAPNGGTAVLYDKPGDTNQNFTNVTFSDHAAQSILLANGPYTNGTFQPSSPLTALNGGPVNGTYELVIDNFSSINSGTLVSWSISVSTTKLGVQFESGAAMDQNADGTSAENPLTAPFTGLTPGDAYVAPMPQPTVPFTFNASNILNPPFDQNTLPLILPGPYMVSTSVPNGTGLDNLVLNGTNDSLNVTFDRPIVVNTAPAGQTPTPGSFTPGQVLQIMGPIGPISGPQSYSSDSTLQTIPAATATGSGSLTSTLTVPSFNGTFTVKKITVQLNIALATDSGLTAVLVAPDGTSVPLFSGVGGNGANFINTTFDDAAETSITTGKAPFTGTFQPTGQLSSLDGKTVDMKNPLDPALWVPGVWKLVLTNSKTGATGTLENWSLNITPVITVTPVQPVNGLATKFTIGFPQQALSGTYTLQIGPDPLTGKFPLDQNGNAIDSSLDAGLSVLRGGTSTSPVTTVRYTSSDLPKVISPSSGPSSLPVTSTIIVPDDFMVQGDTTSSNVSGLRVTLNLTFPSDPGLTLTLEHFDLNGNPIGSVPLATNVGSGSNQTANFTNTVFDDNATTPIQNGGAPFFATFNPQIPLSTFAGMSAQGTWVLAVQNNSGLSGTINSWSLTFQKPLPTSGLGVPGADNVDTSFRIFNLGQADAMSAEAWTPVGAASIAASPVNPGAGKSPEATTANRSGRVSGLAIDPSDPTGDTVYAAGASGGVWKTTDFLTTSLLGPTWIALTDFGPSNAINIGSITVFPRNNNVNQTVIIAATGEGNTGTAGVGFLVSMNGGATWSLDDSSVNVDSSGNPLPIQTNIASLQRNRTFVGDTAYQVVVDPKLTPSGQVIIYAALSGPSGGIWRSEDTGAHWVNMLPGQATSVVLDPESGGVLNPDTDTTVQGNLQVVFAGIRGVGVEMSPNQGQLWSVMSGGVGNPLIINTFVGQGANVNPTNGPTPNGAEGRIVLAVPSATGNAAEDPIYEGWLYAAVATPNNTFFGLFVTKDFGQNWTEVSIPSLPALTATAQAVPTNDVTQPTYPITGLPGQSNYDLTLLSDPTNPNVVYVGGSEDGGETALARVDTTNIWDAHSLVAYSNFSNDGGSVNMSSAGPATITSPVVAPPFFLNEAQGFDDTTSYQNFIRSPQDPFVVNATLDVFDYNSFTNNGAGVTWIPFDPGGTDYHSVTAMVDPLTGLPRLIFGNDQGVWTILDNNGTFETQVGSSASGVTLGSPTAQLAGVDRNGNLQITQFYYGASQPSTAAAEIAGALFYGSAQDDGGPVSDPNIITNGNITWSGPGGDATGVGTDQQGLGSAYQFFWPCCGGNDTDFFQYIGPGLSGTGLGAAGSLSGGYTGRTSGLLQASNNLPTPDPQWPLVAGANFAVNPVNSADVVISSSVGRIFVTQNSGVTWFDVGDPPVFGSPGSFSLALAYGAPDPNAPEGVGNLGNFIYVGTGTGQIYVTQDGGGSGTSNNWINISAGLDGSAVKSISTDPVRGSHDAYAVTTSGVFFTANSIPVNFTGTLTSGAASVTGVSSTTGLTVGETVTGTGIPAGTTILSINSLTDTITLSANATAGGLQSLTGATAWVNITGVGVNNLHNLAYSIFGQNYNPTTDTGNSVTLNQAITLSAIVADWRYQIPNTTGGGFHPALYVGAGGSGSNGSGVFQSLDNGTTWTLFPSLTYGAVAQGGDLPHVAITDLNVSLGNVDTNTGRPTLAGPDQVFVFTGTLTSGSASITGVEIPTLVNTNVTALAAGDSITGTGIPSGTTILSVSPSTNTITLSVPATASGSQSLAAANPTTAPDPDVLLATTYGRGQFAINLAPLILKNSSTGNFVTLTPTTAGSAPSSPPIVTGPITINGLSEISGFGNTTWITVEDVTNPAAPKIIAGFNPANGAAIPGASNSTNAQGNFSIAFNPASVYTSNTLKTIEIFATDNAGSVGNVVTLSFTLNIPGLTPPSPPVTPTLSLASFDVPPTAAPGYTNVATPSLIGVTSPNVSVQLFQVVGTTVTPIGVPVTSDASGNFTLVFPDMTGGHTGTFGPFTVEAQASNTIGKSGFSTPPTTFTIIVGLPNPPKNFRLDPIADTGIKGDNITADRTPDYIGTTTAGATVKLFESSGTNYATTTADANGNFSVQLPFALTNGTISLYVEATDLAGNLSAPSNLLTVTIVSVASDYNGDGVSDPALFSRNTATNQLQWLVKSTVLPPATSAPPPWFVMPIVFAGTLKSGSTSVTGINNTAALVAGQVVTGTGIPSGATILSVNGTTSITLSANATASGFQTLSASTPANVVPFQGDFDGDGKTDLAYYQLSTATWYMYDSRSQTTSSFALGTPTSSIPVVGYFDVNAPEEVAVYTVVNGQGVWSIASAITGLHTVTLPFPVQATDIPVPGNYDGVGHDELAIYRRTTGQYLVDDNGTTETINIPGIGVGTPDLSSLVPVPGNYDPHLNTAVPPAWIENTEAGVYDPNTGVYTILGPSGAYTVSSGFQKGDIPAPADYLGNGATQPVVFRPSTGQFIGKNGVIVATLGQSSNIPLAAPYSYRVPGFQPAGQTGPGTPPTGSTGPGTPPTGSTGPGTTGTGSGTSSTPPPSPPTIIGEIALFSRKLNKHHKPVGKPVLTGFEIIFSTAMNPATAGSASNYKVDSISTKRVKKKPVQVLHPVPITVKYSAASDSVSLLLKGSQAFATGGKITVVAAPTGGVSSALDVLLDGNDLVFSILSKARGITRA